MNNTLFTLAATAATLVTSTLSFLVAEPAQAALFYAFNQTFDEGGTLSGLFSGNDDNNNGQIDADEFTLFKSTFESTESGFEDLTWRAYQLAPWSYFVSASDYIFWITDPAAFPPGGTGWNSSSLDGTTFVGYAFEQDGPISARFSAAEPLNIQSVPEPIPEPLTIFGVGAAIGFGRFFKRCKHKI